MKQLFVKILILSSLLLIYGCKPNQIITEKIYSQIDSSALSIYESEFFQKESLIASLQSDLNRFKEENINLKSEMSRLEIYYDTNAPIDNITRKPPVSSEIITINNNWLQNSIKQNEILLKEAKNEIDNQNTKNSNLYLIIESLKEENKNIKAKTLSGSRFNGKMFFIGIVSGIVLCVILFFYIRKFNKF